MLHMANHISEIGAAFHRLLSIRTVSGGTGNHIRIWQPPAVRRSERYPIYPDEPLSLGRIFWWQNWGRMQPLTWSPSAGSKKWKPPESYMCRFSCWKSCQCPSLLCCSLSLCRTILPQQLQTIKSITDIFPIDTPCYISYLRICKFAYSLPSELAGSAYIAATTYSSSRRSSRSSGGSSNMGMGRRGPVRMTVWRN